MSRRPTTRAAEAAAEQASEAARVLQQRGQEAKVEKAAAEPLAEEAQPADEARLSDKRIDELKSQRPHTRMMDELIERRQANEPKPPADEPEQPAAEPKAEAVEAPVADPAEPVAPKTVKVKVDGEEFDVSQEDVDAAGGVASYQRERAADNRLKKSKDLLEETRKTQAQIAEYLMRQQPAAQPKKAEPTDEQFIQERIDKIRFGTPEESAAAMREVLQRNHQQINPRDLVTQATDEIRHDQAVADFDKEFVDIAKNPILLRAVVAMRNERIPQMPKGQRVDWGDFYRRIGNEVRSAVGQQSQPATPTDKTAGNTSPAPSDKEARKASIVNLPTAAARAELPKEDKPGTPEEERKATIAQMRKSRGIPTG
jgi:hypothetical protein